jgi:hypothetical protein
LRYYLFLPFAEDVQHRLSHFPIAICFLDRSHNDANTFAFLLADTFRNAQPLLIANKCAFAVEAKAFQLDCVTCAHLLSLFRFVRLNSAKPHLTAGGHLEAWTLVRIQNRPVRLSWRVFRREFLG